MVLRHAASGMEVAIATWTAELGFEAVDCEESLNLFFWEVPKSDGGGGAEAEMSDPTIGYLLACRPAIT